jgi:hypothetical protein
VSEEVTPEEFGQRAPAASRGAGRGPSIGSRAIRWAAALASCCLASLPVASARAEVNASVHPSFLPNALGARTAFTFAFRLGAGEEGVPPAVRRIVIHLPAGLGIDLRGVRTCPGTRLLRMGPRGCPAGSLIGHGHAVLAVHAGSQAIPEQAVISAFRGPDRGGRPVIEVLGRGDTPLQEQTLSTGVLAADRAPYGLRLTVSVPSIPTVMYEPDASIVSFSLTVGAVGRRPRAHAASGAVTVPRHCPAGGFRFAADFDFYDTTTASAAARLPCP